MITKSFQMYLFLQDNKLFFDFGRNLQSIVELITKIYYLAATDTLEVMMRLQVRIKTLGISTAPYSFSQSNFMKRQ